MEEQSFSQYLKRKGKQDHVIQGLVRQVQRFESWLAEKQLTLETAGADDLAAFLASLEGQKMGLGKKISRGIALYYAMSGNHSMTTAANDYREAAISKERGGFNLKDIRGVNPDLLEALEKMGIRTTTALLGISRTAADRKALADRAGIPAQVLLELVKLADLSRIPGVKGIRTRLYYDSGVDTLDKLAAWDPVELRVMLVEWVERTKFEGIAALPKEVLFTVETARKLPRLIEY